MVEDDNRILLIFYLFIFSFRTPPPTPTQDGISQLTERSMMILLKLSEDFVYAS